MKLPRWRIRPPYPYQQHRKKVYPFPTRKYREWLKKYQQSFHKGERMTCCVAAVCDNGKSIVLVADKLIGFQFVEAQPDIKKIIQVHKNWWIMFAAEDISPVFEIADSIKMNVNGYS